MERVEIAELEREPHPMGVNRERRDVGAALGTEELGVVHYELQPGEQFSGGLHTHHDQEEAFYVVEGTATFEHGTDEDEVEVEAGEVVHFEPGEFQCGRNRSDEPVVAVALAAPGRRHNWEDLESFAPCGECGEVTSHGVREPQEAFVIYCNECGHEMEIA
ncbi:cupin domain-containing protein [Natronomonas marina]|jgi:uncharacterized cupin superfamily protein|uniref:cupin domain-containing protein n=1 Tax=Natronomonas marina TaxID=2961939 RepID=UPI0020C9E680|nr:cupin domain-containing protein [Natronomonas marina]